MREPFEPEIISRNLRIICEARDRHKEEEQQLCLVWVKQIDERLNSAAASMISRASQYSRSHALIGEKNSYKKKIYSATHIQR
jgi:hypothetical protein